MTKIFNLFAAIVLNLRTGPRIDEEWANSRHYQTNTLLILFIIMLPDANWMLAPFISQMAPCDFQKFRTCQTYLTACPYPKKNPEFVKKKIIRVLSDNFP